MTITAVRVLFLGPPRVSTYGWSKICSALMIAITDATSIVGLTSGSVDVAELLPAGDAVDGRGLEDLFGIAETPPMNSRNVKPKFCRHVHEQHDDLRPEAGGQPADVPDPEQIEELLTKPNSWLNR